VVSSVWRTVAIAGVGLIGGSFALALRKAGFQGRIIGVSSQRTIAAALSRGVIDEALPLRDAAAQADLIYLAQPIEKILENLAELDSAAGPGTLVTDAGSTKRLIVERAATLRNVRFVGGHPMAGKETRGVESAEADLFRGRPYVLTGSDAELEGWIGRIGARLVKLDAREHDRLVALVSHLPQLLSTTLAGMLGEEPASASVAGPAALDMTRLALSPYEIWRDIIATNTAGIDGALAALIARLEQLRRDLADDSKLRQAFAQGARGASLLRSDGRGAAPDIS
jgi:prephenate dehydrogenase